MATDCFDMMKEVDETSSARDGQYPADYLGHGEELGQGGEELLVVVVEGEKTETEVYYLQEVIATVASMVEDFHRKC